MRKLIYLTFTFLIIHPVFSQKTDKTNYNKLIVGKWIKKIDKTKDGKEYFGPKCKDTIQFLSDGNYNWNQCGFKETGKWKISTEKSMIIMYDRKNNNSKYHSESEEIGELEFPIVSISKSQLVSAVAMEADENGISDEISEFYVRGK